MRLLISAISSLLVISAPAAEKKPMGVEATLVSENKTIAPGKKFTVALKLVHQPKFHTYWKNPGIAGVSTKLVWHLPEGFRAGEIQWPYPEKRMMAVHPVHGYERDVMLLVDIVAPEKLVTPIVRLRATASWMACAEGCYPGKIALHLDLPVAPETSLDPDISDEFTKARQEIPQLVSGWNAKLLSPADAPEIRFHLTTDQSSRLPADVYFFSSDGQISSDRPQRIEPKEGGYEFTFERSEFGPSGKTTLPGVLVSSSSLVDLGAMSVAIEAK